MKIFIQGRKDGYNTLYPKPTPADFFKFAADIQRIDAQRDAKYYGKSLYSIAFNGDGCILTKYIIGYDTLRGNIGNIGISIYIAANQKMLGADIKNLLDDLINIYTSNYCPDFKINNQKQEDWLLFTSAANNYDSKVKTISADENFQYGNKDAAYIFYNNVAEIEKYLENPYQEEYKEHKQIFFIEKQLQLILEVIKYDQTANLSGKIDLESPPYKLKEYYGEGKNGVSIEIRANGKLRNNKDKIFGKDNVSIKYSKKYYDDIFVEGKLSEPQIEKYLKIYDSSIDVERNPEITPTKKTVEIRINDSKGNPISNAIIACKNNYSKSVKQVYENTINFSGEEQKDRWTISAKKDLFTGEDTFTPEHTSIVKLTLKEVKNIKLQVIYGANTLISKNLIFYDDDIRKEHTEPINIKGYKTQTKTFIPNTVIGDVVVVLEKQVIQQPIIKDPKDGPTGDVWKIPKPQMLFKIKILLGSSIACLLVLGVYFSYDMLLGCFNKTTKETEPTVVGNTVGVIKLDTTTIIRYVQGDSLFLEKLNEYQKKWAELKKTTKVIEYTKIESHIKRAIKKREAINKKDFAYLKDSCRYIGLQETFKKAVIKIMEACSIKKIGCENVKTKLGEVSKLTLTEITAKINEILNPKIDNSKKLSTNPKTATSPTSAAIPSNTIIKNDEPKNDSTQIITNYLKGNDLKFKNLEIYKSSTKNQDLKKSIILALEFWSLDKNSMNYSQYLTKIKKDIYLKSNTYLIDFLQQIDNNATYPKDIEGNATKTFKEIKMKLK